MSNSKTEICPWCGKEMIPVLRHYPLPKGDIWVCPKCKGELRWGNPQLWCYFCAKKLTPKREPPILVKYGQRIVGACRKCAEEGKFRLANPLRYFRCSICGTSAPKSLLPHSKFTERMSWLRRHYRSKHPVEFRRMYEKNPILEAIGTGVLTGLGVGSGFVVASKAINKVWKNPDISDYKLILEVMPPNTPLTTAQIARRIGLSSKETRTMLGELVRYGLIRATIDGYVRKNPGKPRKVCATCHKYYTEGPKTGVSQCAACYRKSARSRYGKNPAKPHTEVVVSKLPKCDFCSKQAQYDFKTRMGPWANGCLMHFKMYGYRLGLGKGQKLILRRQK